VNAKLTLAEKAQQAPSPELLAFVDALAEFAADLYLAGLLSAGEPPQTAAVPVAANEDLLADKMAYGQHHEHAQACRPPDERSEDGESDRTPRPA
jgi:hypothetical protein